MISSIIPTTITTYSITGSLHSLLGLLVYHLPPLTVLGILPPLEVVPHPPVHQVVAQVVHQTHYSTLYLLDDLLANSSFSRVLSSSGVVVVTH